MRPCLRRGSTQPGRAGPFFNRIVSFSIFFFPFFFWLRFQLGVLELRWLARRSVFNVDNLLSSTMAIKALEYIMDGIFVALGNGCLLNFLIM